VPLVTTGAGGVQSLVEGAATLVPVGDAGALRAAIEQVLADEDRRSLLVAAGRARAKLWPDESAALDELVANYRELLRRVSLR
jgi:glycosyltransferase involved in cell wall biosynthesis